MAVLSKRLDRVASFVPQGARLLDVGSDHAYLPLWLLSEGKIQFAIAGEVVEGPYQIALANVQASAHRDRATVRLADGLAAAQDQDKIDTVVIAGMGGALIADILSRGSEILQGVQRLILQPNNQEDQVRKWLSQKGYAIQAEAVVEEGGKFYEIIVAEKGHQQLSEAELRFGPCLMAEKSETFVRRWLSESQKLKRALARIPLEKSEERSALSQKIKKMEEVSYVSASDY